MDCLNIVGRCTSVGKLGSTPYTALTLSCIPKGWQKIMSVAGCCEMASDNISQKGVCQEICD